MRFSRSTLLLALGLLQGCLPLNSPECDANCEENWLDGETIRDPSLTDPSYRISTRISDPSPEDLDKPVILAVHGFTATTYEWLEFRDSMEVDSQVLVSLILLGGHGRDTESFRKSTWEEWGRPIMEEYGALEAKGYTRLSIATASTGGALLLEQFSSGAFRDLRPPEHVFLIDPIVAPSDKMLSMVNLAGGILGNSRNSGTEEENRHWYVDRPAETLSELYELVALVKSRLERGFPAPPGTHVKVYKSKYDGSADPISALYIKKGLEPSDGGRVEVEMVDSRKHVFTREWGRPEESWTAEDEALQRRVFAEMKSMVLD